MKDVLGIYSSPGLIVADEVRTYGGEMLNRGGLDRAVVAVFPGRVNGRGPLVKAEVAFPAEYAGIVADSIMDTARAVLR
jgi:hypothetical protein